MSSLWTNLLFLHGHITDVGLARRLAETPAPAAKPGGKRLRKETRRAGGLAPAQVPPCDGACATRC